MAELVTTLGPVGREALGIVLPHEHVFTDLRTPDTEGHAEADVAEVVRVMAPELERARASGIGVIVECTPVGVGRRADILLEVSEAVEMPLVVATGVYREPWIPVWVHDAPEEELAAWMQGELEGEIESTGVQAGFVKLSVGDDGMTDCERKVARAAARAASATDATVGSHTVKGRVVLEQLGLLESCGLSPRRFIAIHASAEPDFELNLEVARRGAWVEYDWIGGDAETDALILDRILRMLDAGYGHRLLLSQDRGFYDPSKPGGGEPRPYTFLVEQFLRRLRSAGVDEATIVRLTIDNPFRAFAR